MSQEGSTNPTGTGPQSWSLTGATVTASTSAPVTLNRVQGLPSNAGKSQPHKYLIETNPVLTDLKQFMSSDYLLSNLGYDPDQSAKRLGDGLYEQRLIQQAVVARTGQRFIDGQTSDEGLFKYLMNNAIASKTELNLSLGVSLTSEQVAALTHDIVWMENAEVNGEQVLVPVLYLANANNRLAANGALIQGRDVTLIAGKDLNNAGTLRASNNLSATATNDLVSSGLVEAGNRLDLLATNNLTNKAGGIIAGRDVSQTATRGDVINERTVTTHESASGYRSERTDFADNAARIEAANDLTVKAGQDINIAGGVMQSGRDMDLNAGRDLNVSSAQVTNSVFRDSKHNSSDITQLGASISAGRDLSADAGRDINVSASQIDAKRDIAMSAVDNLTISSAADEEHSLSKSKKLTVQEDHVSQVMSGVTAGGNVKLDAGKDLAVISSRITAGDEAYLVAGDKLDLLAAKDSDYSLYDMKKKGSFGAKKTQRDEVTDVKYIGSEITTGGNLTLASGGDQRYQVAKLESGKDITLDSGGNITFEGVKDLHDESHTKSDGDLAWFKAKGSGTTDETLRQSQLVAQGRLVIKAAGQISIDIKQVDQQSVSQTIDAMVKADPALAWMKEAEARGDINWRQVKEIHESFKYDTSGLGAGAKIAIAILMSFIMGPAGLGLVGAGAGGAVVTSLATTAVTSTISNKGNLGAAFKETFSADSLKGAAIAGFTAGMLDYADANWFAGASEGTKSILTSTNFTDIATRLAGRAVISSGISTAIGGGSFGDNLGAALVGEAGNVAMATGFNWIGDITIKFPEGSLEKVVAHALMGGLLSKAMGGDFATGAAAAGLNEAMMNQLISLANGNDQLQVMMSQLTGLVAAAAVDGDLQQGANIAENATTYNYLYHREVKEMLAEMDSKETEEEKRAVRDRYAALDDQRELERDELCKRSPEICQAIAHGLVDDDQKLTALIEQLRAEDKGGAAFYVGHIQEGNLSSAGSMAADVSSLNGSALTRVAADFVKMGIGIIPGLGAGKGATTPKEIGTITTRTTKNETRLGGQPGEPGVKIVFKDGTEFDMTRTRVKETESNPYVPGRTRPVKFDDAVNKQGDKRAPTKAELEWFDSIKWD
ncbi:filamentous hemagglutinin [Pseudomonas umsongensis]|uniref:Filamentous hemagglutinin n=1 Tax=Pseudomonas umsongensis TaxID=198618 RepID=A0ACC5MA92_9PSED|nr:filamentous hemagglutinin [Pseudomonas umsongensis]